LDQIDEKVVERWLQPLRKYEDLSLESYDLIFDDPEPSANTNPDYLNPDP
jgi:hypothetical protein